MFNELYKVGGNHPTIGKALLDYRATFETPQNLRLWPIYTQISAKSSGEDRHLGRPVLAGAP